MNDHECPACYLNDEVDPKCMLCNGSNRISHEDLKSFRDGEAHADHLHKTHPDSVLWAQIIASCMMKEVE